MRPTDEEERLHRESFLRLKPFALLGRGFFLDMIFAMQRTSIEDLEKLKGDFEHFRKYNQFPDVCDAAGSSVENWGTAIAIRWMEKARLDIHIEVRREREKRKLLETDNCGFTKDPTYQ
jgi:hypothetical protein